MVRKNRKAKYVVWIVLAAIALFFIASYSGLFDSANLPFSVVPITSFPTQTLSPFTCNEQYCTAQGVTDCQVGGEAPKVKFRTNGQWIAWDIDGSGLRCYLSGGDTNPHCNAPFSTSITIASDKPVFPGKTFFANSVHVFEKILNGDQYCSSNVFLAASPSICDMTPTATYNPGYTEVIQGSSYVFNCPNVFEVRDNSGSLVYSENIAYQGSTPGTRLSQPYQNMHAGWIAKITGTGYINYGTFEDRESCAAGNQPKCNADDTGYYECVLMNGTYYLDTGTPHYCDLDAGEICSNGQCAFPITYDIQFVDDYGNSKTGFDPSENIKISSKITSNSNQITHADVKFLLYEYGSVTPFIEPYEKPNYDLTKQQRVYTSIINPGAAYLGQQFYVVVALTYNGRTVYVGNQNKEFSFRIAPALSCNAQFVSEIGEGTQFTLYKGLPARLSVYTLESGQPLPVDSFPTFDVSLDTGTQTINVNLNPQSPDSQGTGTNAYVYSWDFIPMETGMLDATIQVQKSGVTQNCIVTSRRVNPITVLPDFTDIDKYISGCALTNQPITLHIETKDSIGNFVDTEPILKVIRYDQTVQEDITELLLRDDVGRYHFTYAPSSNVYFQLSSALFAPFNTGTIEVLDNCAPPECSVNADCISKGSNYICQNSVCITNGSPEWITYLAIGVGILAGIIILLVIVKAVRKPRQEVFTGAENL